MIWESTYWKQDLIKDAEILARWANKPHSIRREVLFEKKIFISAYAIRKLIEAEKIGSDFPVWNISVSRFPRINKETKIDFLNAHHLEKFYDIKSKEQTNKDLIFLSNLVIHSLSFCLSVTEKDQVDGFWVTSDKHSLEFLYRIELKDFIRILQSVGHCDVISFHYERKENGNTIKRKYVFCCLPKNLLTKKALTLNEYLVQCQKMKTPSECG